MQVKIETSNCCQFADLNAGDIFSWDTTSLGVASHVCMKLRDESYKSNLYGIWIDLNKNTSIVHINKLFDWQPVKRYNAKFEFENYEKVKKVQEDWKMKIEERETDEYEFDDLEPGDVFIWANSNLEEPHICLKLCDKEELIIGAPNTTVYGQWVDLWYYSLNTQVLDTIFERPVKRYEATLKIEDYKQTKKE